MILIELFIFELLVVGVYVVEYKKYFGSLGTKTLAEGIKTTKYIPPRYKIGLTRMYLLLPRPKAP